jgi:hypothetical protein
MRVEQGEESKVRIYIIKRMKEKERKKENKSYLASC